ncbi:MAG: TrkA C-terminal domain-containing protein, partial [Anaerolineales bacterium]|nr:TrkA C-terminal domain-containing protein [Anaerolineales bacterium]
AQVEKAQTVVALDKDDETNLRVTRIARHTFGIDQLVAWVHDPAQNIRFRQLGARILNPAFSSVLITEGMVLNPEIYSITTDMDEGHDVREVKLQNPDLLNQPITALDLPAGVTILMIERGGDILVPDEATVLRANDTVMLVGGEVDETARLFAKQS